VSRLGLRSTIGLVLAAVLAAAGARAETRVDDFRARMEKWVETRQILSQERSEWEAEKETLKATRDLLQQQKDALAAEVKELEENSTAADDVRRDLLLQRGELQRSSGELAGAIRSLEEQVLALVPRLPETLQKKLEPLLVQIPDDPEKARQPLGTRLMNVLGVLSQTEKWNATATMVGETRAVEGDQKVQVRTLYWGLGQAVYVDAQGKLAGVGRPGEEGWEFTDEPGLADRARLLLDISEGNVDVIDFVKMPVEVR
jgi:gas vesicle protein